MALGCIVKTSTSGTKQKEIMRNRNAATSYAVAACGRSNGVACVDTATNQSGGCIFESNKCETTKPKKIQALSIIRSLVLFFFLATAKIRALVTCCPVCRSRTIWTSTTGPAVMNNSSSSNSSKKRRL